MGTHVNPWLIHVNVWQKPLQYCKLISLQLIKINGKKLQKKERYYTKYFTDNNEMKLEINNRSKSGKVTKLWKSKQQTFKQPVDQRKSLKGN